jgi:hypothetical protein
MPLVAPVIKIVSPMGFTLVTPKYRSDRSCLVHRFDGAYDIEMLSRLVREALGAPPGGGGRR